MSIIRPEQCAKCKFSLPRAHEQNKFDCRRNPPTAAIFPQQNERGQLVGSQIISGWPLVQGEQWCGEFRPNIVGVN